MTAERVNSRGWVNTSSGASVRIEELLAANKTRKHKHRVKKGVREEGGKHTQKIFSMLKERDMTTNELAQALGIPVSQFNSAMTSACAHEECKIIEVGTTEKRRGSPQIIWGWLTNHEDDL